MCYVVITCRSLAWFLLTVVCNLFILTAMVTPKWLIGPQDHSFDDPMLENTTIHRNPSVGINTRYHSFIEEKSVSVIMLLFMSFKMIDFKMVILNECTLIRFSDAL